MSETISCRRCAEGGGIAGRGSKGRRESKGSGAEIGNRRREKNEEKWGGGKEKGEDEGMEKKGRRMGARQGESKGRGAEIANQRDEKNEEKWGGGRGKE